ncbi:unnamed protein product, partial [Didymodactylos carnosus]
LVATSLTINQPPPVTMQERQMAEQLADTIALLSKGPKFDYYEEITLDLGEMSDEEHSEEEEETSEIEAGTEEADPDCSRPEIYLWISTVFGIPRNKETEDTERGRAGLQKN